MNDRKVPEPIRDRSDSASELPGSLERLHQQVCPRLVVLQDHRIWSAATRVTFRRVLP